MSADSKKVLEKVDSILTEEGKGGEELVGLDKLTKFIIPGLENSKNTLSSLYKYTPKDKKGITGKLKNKVLGKIKNVVLNVVERESMRQQKFNELSFQAIDQLTREIEELNEKIESLTSNNGKK